MKLIIEIFLFFCPFFSFSSFKAGYHSGYNLCEWVVCGHLEESVFWSFIGWSVLEISTGSDIFQFFNVFFNSLLFILVLGFELRALLLDPHPQPFSLALFFGIGSWVYVWAGLDLDQSYLCVPQSWDDRYTPPQPAAYWLRWGLKDFAQADFKPRSSWTWLPRNWDYRHEPPYQPKSPIFFLFFSSLCVCVCLLLSVTEKEFKSPTIIVLCTCSFQASLSHICCKGLLWGVNT
jgi:hypothetical protein